MKLACSLSSRARAFAERFWRSSRGSVAVEFVIIVPLMLLTLTGFVEAYAYLRAVSVLEHTAFTLADSIGQMVTAVDSTGTSSANTLGSMYAAAGLLAQPNTLSSNGGVIITSICDTSSCNAQAASGTTAAMANGTPYILWQRSAPWTQSGFTSKITATNIFPSSWPFRTGDSAIVVEVFYKYTPFAMTSAFWKNAPGTQTIYQRVYVRPRSGTPLKFG